MDPFSLRRRRGRLKPHDLPQADAAPTSFRYSSFSLQYYLLQKLHKNRVGQREVFEYVADKVEKIMDW